MFRRFAILIVAFVTGLLFSPIGLPAVHAGGWAITTLDPLPPISSGEPALIEFTILQHGRTPVLVDGVTIDIRSAGGKVETFTAVPATVEGRYAVTVVFPESGEYTWVITQGWFGPQELGSVRIAASDVGSATGASDSSRWPSTVRYGLLAASLGLISMGGFDHLRNRRRLAVA
jgi:hypothetical protein